MSDISETLKKGEEVLKSLKADIDAANSSIGRLEGHKSSLESKRDALYLECKELGIDPEKLEEYLTAGEAKLAESIAKAEECKVQLAEFNTKIKAVV